MPFNEFVTDVAYILFIVFAFLSIRAVWLMLSRFEANTAVEIANAALDEAQAQKIRATTGHFEEKGGYLFWIDGILRAGLPFLQVGPTPAVTASGEPVDPQEVDALKVSMQLLEASITKYTAGGNQIVTYEDSNIDHNAHAEAIKWLARLGVVMPTNGGVFTRDMNLAGLRTLLNLKSAMQKLSAGERA